MMKSHCFEPFPQACKYRIQKNDSCSNTKQIPKLERVAKSHVQWLTKTCVRCADMEEKRGTHETIQKFASSYTGKVTSSEHVRYIGGAFITVS